MDNNWIEITIDGRTYYIEAERLSDLAFINGRLVNTSNSSITLVNNFDTVTTYPRITCASMSQCIYRSSQQASQIGVTSNYSYNGNFNINTLSQGAISQYILFILILLLGVKLLWKR